MAVLKDIKDRFYNGVHVCYDIVLNDGELPMNETRHEFSGDYTFVIFSLVKQLKKSPKEIGDTLGQWMLSKEPLVIGFEVIQGFLNLTFSNEFGIEFFSKLMIIRTMDISQPMEKRYW